MATKIAKLNSTKVGSKVDHPLAKYNSRGDLYCLLCNNLIKNANIWKVHLSSKQHKESLLVFKAGKSKSDTLKRQATKGEEAPPRSLKKAKLSEEVNTPKLEIPDKVESQPIKTGILKASSKVVPKLPEGFVPKSRLAAQAKTVVASEDQVRKIEEKSNLPTGFFDNNAVIVVSPEDEPDEMEADDEDKDNKQSDAKSSTLPDGFFDDAREDAKARKVEYKDPQELEWEKFQNEMEQEDLRYNSILEEDDQKLREDREIDIGIEQKLWDYRVESISSSAKTGEICIVDKELFEVKLAGKSEKFEVGVKKEEPNENDNVEMDIKMEEAENDNDSDDSDDELMDWRTKSRW